MLEAPEISLLLLSFVGFMGVLEIGFRLGFRHKDREGSIERAHINSLQAALFGLLSLLLGFNFSMAASRFETRKAVIQEEVDAIASVSLRARLLPTAERHRILGLLAEYTSSRLAAEFGSTESSRIRERLWAEVEEISGRNPQPPAFGLLIPALDSMSNAAWKRRAVLENHLPALTIALMLTISVGALLLLSYSYGLTGIRRHHSSAILALMISLVLTTIIDLDQPDSGMIRVGSESMSRLKASLEELAK